MTGAGKTHTMLGDLRNPDGEPGIITLVVNDLFSRFESEENSNYEFSVKFSYVEIYNEQAKDLIGDSTENLMIVEDQTRGVVALNLTEHTIQNSKEVLELMQLGNSRRKMAETNSNQFSSRSHAIVQLAVQKRDKTKDVTSTYTQSKFLLVDLAGSERAAVSENRGMRQIEGANINRSLLALGNCINTLSDPNKRGAFVPYRDSKLTRLLKDSLGGNTKTIMIACVSPCHLHYEETANTLKYASNAKRIKRQITKNVKEVEMHISQYREIIDSLKAEIASLRKQLNERNLENRINDVIKSEEQKSVFLPAEILQGASATLEELGNKLLSNLEEHWEIRQSLNELQELKKQNERLIEQRQKEFDEMGKTPDNEIAKDIEAIKENMESNEKILKEMQAALEKNAEERKNIQEKIKSLGNQDLTARGEEKDGFTARNTQDGLVSLCKVLNVEKLELQAENAEMKRETMLLNKLKNEKDMKISKLEQEVEIMKKKLQEKVKLPPIATLSNRSNYRRNRTENYKKTKD